MLRLKVKIIYSRMAQLVNQKTKRSIDLEKDTLLSSPELDDAFYVFALRITSKESIGRRKLSADKYYYMLDGFNINEDRILVSKERYKKTIYDYYVKGTHSCSPHISISAIVGENGSGKSTLVEFELRLINNFSAVVFGEYAKAKSSPHLHYIDGIDGELYYVLKQNIYCLSVKSRKVKLYCYTCQGVDKDGNRVFTLSDDIIQDNHNYSNDELFGHFNDSSYYDSIKKLLPHFFYTVVLNQSVYAYNTRDFKEECNSEEYEVSARYDFNTNEKEEIIPYSTEDKCWLNGLFHKNDGYQIPIVLTPYRFEGNYDINMENRLAFERLISIMVRAEESERIINGHMKVVSFNLKPKDNEYDINYLHQKVGYRQFSEADYKIMKRILLECWSEHVQCDICRMSRSRRYRRQAINYLVYKTLKIADTYDEYRLFKDKYNNLEQSFNEKDFKSLVEYTIDNNSHVTNKLFRTIAYLIWDIYEKLGGSKNNSIPFEVNDINARFISAIGKKRLGFRNPVASSLKREAAIPPPFFETSIGLVELNTGAYVPFEYLSSGEKQQAFTTSSLVYHLKNLDSVCEDRSTEDRVDYENVQLILEEVELYFHPELQRQFVRNLLDGIRQSGLSHIKWINICIVTHSPFVLSDIPSYNVLALKKEEGKTEKIRCFAANIHDMLKLSFFLEKGSVGDFASWTTMRIAKCLRVARWINRTEHAPAFFPSLKELPPEYKFLEDFKNSPSGKRFSKKSFMHVYSPEVLYSQINMIEEPVVRRVLLDDFKRTYPEKEDEYKKAMRELLKSQLDALED